MCMHILSLIVGYASECVCYLVTVQNGWLYISYRLKSIKFKYTFHFLNSFIFNLCTKLLKTANGESLDRARDFGNIDQ